MNESYDERLANARHDIAGFDGNVWDLVVYLHECGYSLRIIAEITNISRSKIQRFLSESNYDNLDDIRSQGRSQRVNQASRLFKMGFNPGEIAEELDVNVRTVESYLRQAGMKEGTKFGDMEDDG